MLNISYLVPTYFQQLYWILSSFCYAFISGSIFELFGGTPQLGMVGTGAIALVGTPLCLYLFYAAVLKGNAETEEDDKKFLGGR
jgi:hypothetical protein